MLKDLCSRYGLDQQRIVAAFAVKNVKADPKKTLKEIADEHGLDCHTLFTIIHAVAVQR